MWSDMPCKIWKGNKDSSGYPTRWNGIRQISITREVLEKKLERPIRVGYECCHYCDTPTCVEPTHLWEGTHTQNLEDAQSKGRHTGKLGITKTHCIRGHEFTEENTYKSPYGYQKCRACIKIRATRQKAKRNE